jgi:TonB family protein
VPIATIIGYQFPAFGVFFGQFTGRRAQEKVRVNNSSSRILPSSRLILATSLAVIMACVPALILFKAPVQAQTQSTPQQPVAQENRKTKFVVQPEYPELAKRNNISGTARVQAVIAPDGSVKEVKVLGGSPVLAQAAVDAVKRWKYEPGPNATTAVLKFDFKPGQ